MKSKVSKIDPKFDDSLEKNNYEIIGSSKVIADCKNNALKIAKSDAPVLITGESGTGKELFANFIFKESKRNQEPFIQINCAALPDSMIEAELFGHVKGAFTDAVSDRKGKFIAADNGTIFLDEICELPVHVQPRLLRVIENNLVDRLGSDTPYRINVRVISATNRNIKEEVRTGNFRKDLFYRLNVLSLHIPPLREHKNDIPELVKYFSAREFEQGEENNKENKTLNNDAINKLFLYDWPGNVRELKNYLKRLFITSNSQIIGQESIDFEVNEENSSLTLKNAINKFKKKYIIDILSANNWNQSKTAAVLDIQRTYLSRLIKELEIDVKIKE
ncbi:MAG: sigma-54 dependent transcriptional regulator [Spirochaetes bacterium]|nr:sigma-54 dependent transcriptional regulator [Spirochaetota bacterium]